MTTILQINLGPIDLPHLIHILPHQIRQLGGQVDEILLTLDLHQSRGSVWNGLGKNGYLVPRRDLELFARLAGPRTHIRCEADFLPSSFVAVPSASSR